MEQHYVARLFERAATAAASLADPEEKSHVFTRRVVSALPFGLSGAASVIALAALVVLGIATWRIALAAQPYRWSMTAGLITQSSQASEFVAIKIGKFENTRITEERFHVKYSYQVAGHPYTGDRIDVLTRPGRKYVLTGERRYPLGSTVSVRYDPSNPTRAVLETDIPWGAVFAAVLAIAVLSLVFVPTRARASPRHDGRADAFA